MVVKINNPLFSLLLCEAGTKDMYIYISFFVHSCFQLPWREIIGYISRGDPTFINLDRR